MIRLLLAVAVLIAASNPSEARRRHRHYDRGPAEAVQMAPEGFSPSDDRRQRRSTRNTPPLVALVPPTWRVLPPDPNWQGKRFVSPDGASWFAAYTAPAEANVTAHMKAVTFVDGETVTYLQGTKDWVAVSGLKDGRVFYRKAMMACGGAKWHQVAFEYPTAAKREMDAFVSMAAASLANTLNDGCSDPKAVAGTTPAIAPPVGSAAPAPTTGRAGQ